MEREREFVNNRCFPREQNFIKPIQHFFPMVTNGLWYSDPNISDLPIGRVIPPANVTEASTAYKRMNEFETEFESVG